MGTTESLARWIATTSFEQIPTAACDQARKSILDFLGTSIQGSTTEAGRIISGFIRDEGGRPQARIIATDMRTTSANAAFANGALGHADDFDDQGGVGGHPAVVLTPPALAIGEELQRSGREVLAAWIIGYEVGTRLSRHLLPDRDWHATAIFGTMAAAVVASKLLRLDENQIRMALGIAASEASGLRRNFGTMTKPFHAGHAARSGVIAAKLAARGLTADPDIIEGRQGFADNFGGARCNLPAVTAFLGDFFYLASEGTETKPWPACGSSHEALTALFDLMERQSIDPAEVESVEHIGPKVPYTGPMFRDQVRTGLEGKFSLRYTIAAALVDGKVDLETFTDARVAEGDLQTFMARVRLGQNPEAGLRRPHIADGNSEAQLILRMRHGRVHDLLLAPALHLDYDATLNKYRAHAERVLDRDRVNRSVDLMARFETLADVTTLMDMITLGQE